MVPAKAVVLYLILDTIHLYSIRSLQYPVRTFCPVPYRAGMDAIEKLIILQSMEKLIHPLRGKLGTQPRAKSRRHS